MRERGKQAHRQRRMRTERKTKEAAGNEKYSGMQREGGLEGRNKEEAVTPVCRIPAQGWASTLFFFIVCTYTKQKQFLTARVHTHTFPLGYTAVHTASSVFANEHVRSTDCTCRKNTCQYGNYTKKTTHSHTHTCSFKNTPGINTCPFIALTRRSKHTCAHLLHFFSSLFPLRHFTTLWYTPRRGSAPPHPHTKDV